MAQPKRFDINKVENFLKNSADKAEIVSHWNAAYEHGETIRTIDENLARNDDNKQIAELLLRRIDVINRRERLFKAIQNAIKILVPTPDILNVLNSDPSDKESIC